MNLLSYLEQSLNRLIGDSAPATTGDDNLLHKLGEHLSQFDKDTVTDAYHNNDGDTDAYLDVVLNGGDHIDALRHLEHELTPEQGQQHDTNLNQDSNTGQPTSESDAQSSNIAATQPPATAGILQPEDADDNNLVQNSTTLSVGDADSTNPELSPASLQHPEQASDALATNYGVHGPETAADGPEGSHCDFASGSFDSMGNGSAG